MHKNLELISLFRLKAFEILAILENNEILSYYVPLEDHWNELN
jgi:hypothetical protein